MTKNTSLIKRRRTSLEMVTAASGAFGAMTAALVGGVLIWVTGGGLVSAAFIAVFSIGVGGVAGWMLGRASSGLLGKGNGDGED